MDGILFLLKTDSDKPPPFDKDSKSSLEKKTVFWSWSTYELFMTDSLITNSNVKGAYFEMANFLTIAW